MTKAIIVIIHGSYGNPQENWFPWIADELRKLGHKVIVPIFPTPEGQSERSWIEAFSKQVGKIKNNMILVGHSLGVGFILRILQDTEEPVLGTFLVSGFVGKLNNEEFDQINADFFKKPLEWTAIKKNSGAVHVYNSDNDPYVPLEKGTEIALKLGIRLKVIQNGGHINTAAGFVKFPMLLEDIKTSLQK